MIGPGLGYCSRVPLADGRGMSGARVGRVEEEGERRNGDEEAEEVETAQNAACAIQLSDASGGQPQFHSSVPFFLFLRKSFSTLNPISAFFLYF